MSNRQNSNRDVFEVASDDVAGTGPYPHKRKRLPRDQEENLAEALAAFVPIAGGAILGRAAGRRIGKWVTRDGVNTDLAKSSFGTSGMILGGISGTSLVPRKDHSRKRRKQIKNQD